MKFPNDFEEVQKLYSRHCKEDPLTEIQPGLLGSADIAEYASKTGMIWPFDTSLQVDKDKLSFHDFKKDEFFNNEEAIRRLCCEIYKQTSNDFTPKEYDHFKGVEYLNKLLLSPKLLPLLEKNTESRFHSFRITKHKNKYDKDHDLKYLKALNRVAIEDYFDGFSPKSNKYECLKPASYEIPFRGEVICCDENNKMQSKNIIKTGDTYTLKENSIAFVNLDTYFHIPDYIALRFNLRITHVHRGLLLGTGPLIDPGFGGKLLVPLHNLTNNSYTFEFDEGFIWVEFTKICHNNEKPTVFQPHKFPTAEFPEEKKFKDPFYYFSKANNGNPIDSSVSKLDRAVKKAEENVASIINRIQTFGYISLVALAVTLGGLFFAALSFNGTSENLIMSVQRDIRSKLDQLENENELIRRELEVLKAKQGKK